MFITSTYKNFFWVIYFSFNSGRINWWTWTTLGLWNRLANMGHRNGNITFFRMVISRMVFIWYGCTPIEFDTHTFHLANSRISTVCSKIKRNSAMKNWIEKGFHSFFWVEIWYLILKNKFIKKSRKNNWKKNTQKTALFWDFRAFQSPQVYY